MRYGCRRSDCLVARAPYLLPLRIGRTFWASCLCTTIIFEHANCLESPFAWGPFGPFVRCGCSWGWVTSSSLERHWESAWQGHPSSRIASAAHCSLKSSSNQIVHDRSSLMFDCATTHSSNRPFFHSGHLAYDSDHFCSQPFCLIWSSLMLRWMWEKQHLSPAVNASCPCLSKNTACCYLDRFLAYRLKSIAQFAYHYSYMFRPRKCPWLLL